MKMYGLKGPERIMPETFSLGGTETRFMLNIEENF